MADGTIRLQIDCQEVDPTDEAEIFKLRKQLGYLVFATVENITEKDIPTESLEFPEAKSPSRVLRSVYYRQWEKLKPTTKQGKKIEFEVFYKIKMERNIEHEKQVLSELE